METTEKNKKAKTSEIAEIVDKQRNVTIITNVLWLVAVIAIVILFVRERKLTKEMPVYVISDNGRFIAKPTSGDQIYEFDVRNDVKVFISNFYEYDKNDFNDKVEFALNMVDNASGKEIYASVKKAKIYDALRDRNARTKVEYDSIKVDMNRRPIHVKAFFKQNIYVSDIKMTNPVAADFDIIPFNRSEKNPFGLIISNFTYIPYTPVMNNIADPNYTSQQDAQNQINQAKQGNESK